MRKIYILFQISAVCKGVCAYMHTTFLVGEIAAKFYTGNKEPPKNRQRVFFFSGLEGNVDLLQSQYNLTTFT